MAKMAKVLAIVSGKGGVGKTLVAINLAMALNNFGRRVLLIDGDIKKPNISVYLNHPHSQPTLHDVLEGKIPIKDAAMVHESGLKYIAGDNSIKRLNRFSIGSWRCLLTRTSGLWYLMLLP